MKPLAQNTLIQNRYLIVHLIGKGGMGEVYLAVDQRLGSAVALKRTFFADDEMLGNAFEREARTLARLRHPVLPKVSDHFMENHEQYLVMEHISGDDLAKRLELAQKPFPVSWVMFWADQLLDALSYLHSHEPPIIHRDIKPQNLKLTDENHIVLLDFGLSKSSTGKTHLTSAGRSGSSGSVVGYTPHYAPMEQIRGIGTNARSDIYSLSATVYQLLTNSIPPDALTRADVMLNGSPDPLQGMEEINPEVPKAVSDIILRGMEVSQEKRFATAREMQKALRQSFNKMQQEMSAETVAFNINSPELASVAIPSISDVETRIAAPEANGSEPGSGYETALAPPAVDFEATIAIDPAEVSGARQSDIRTEVFVPNSLPFPAAEERADFDSFSGKEDITSGNSDLSVQANDESSDHSPQPAVPVVTVGVNDSHAGASQTGAYEAVSGNTAAGFYETAPAESFVAEERLDSRPIRPAPVAQPQPKSSGKALLILGALGLFFVLLIGGAGAGWYFFANYGGVVETEPTPTPLPTATPLPTPSPEPTVESVADTNTSPANSANTSTSNTATAAEPTPAPTVAPNEPDRPVVPKPTPAARTTPARTSTPQASKPTPQPKRTNDRPVILQ